MTLSRNTISKRLQHILSSFTTAEDADAEGTLSVADKLQIILSESSQALALVLTVEDEFDIELSDDEVDLTFFTDFERMLDRVENRVRAKHKRLSHSSL